MIGVDIVSAMVAALGEVDTEDGHTVMLIE